MKAMQIKKYRTYDEAKAMIPVLASYTGIDLIYIQNLRCIGHDRRYVAFDPGNGKLVRLRYPVSNRQTQISRIEIEIKIEYIEEGYVEHVDHRRELSYGLVTISKKGFIPIENICPNKNTMAESDMLIEHNTQNHDELHRAIYSFQILADTAKEAIDNKALRSAFISIANHLKENE